MYICSFNTLSQFCHAFNSIPTQIGTGLFHLFLTQVACLYPTNSNPELQVNLAIRPRDLILTRPFFSEFLIDGHRARISIKWIELLHLKKHYNQIKIPKNPFEIKMVFCSDSLWQSVTHFMKLLRFYSYTKTT